MQAVLISIHPKWCEYIASGKKTVEVRKTKPKLKTPFKVFIYATKQKHYYKISDHLLTSDENLYLSEGKLEMSDCFKFWNSGVAYQLLNRKIIGEFVCNKIEDLRYDALEMTYFSRKYRDAKLLDEEFFPGTQVTYQEAYDYCKGMSYGEEDSDLFYGWHISDLKIYDKPRELSEFYVWKKCNSCRETGYESTACMYDEDCKVPAIITRPPQSWMYVEVEG